MKACLPLALLVVGAAALAGQSRARRLIDSAYAEPRAGRLGSAEALLRPVLDSSVRADPGERTSAYVLYGRAEFFKGSEPGAAQAPDHGTRFSPRSRGYCRDRSSAIPSTYGERECRDASSWLGWSTPAARPSQARSRSSRAHTPTSAVRRCTISRRRGFGPGESALAPCESALKCRWTSGFGRGEDPAGDRTQDLRIKSQEGSEPVHGIWRKVRDFSPDRGERGGLKLPDDEPKLVG